MQVNPFLIDALKPKVAAAGLLGQPGPLVTTPNFDLSGAKVAVTSPLIGGFVPKVASTSPLVDPQGPLIHTGNAGFDQQFGPLANDPRYVSPQIPEAGFMNPRETPLHPSELHSFWPRRVRMRGFPTRAQKPVLSVHEAEAQLRSAQLEFGRAQMKGVDLMDQAHPDLRSHAHDVIEERLGPLAAQVTSAQHDLADAKHAHAKMAKKLTSKLKGK